MHAPKCWADERAAESQDPGNLIQPEKLPGRYVSIRQLGSREIIQPKDSRRKCRKPRANYCVCATHPSCELSAGRRERRLTWCASSRNPSNPSRSKADEPRTKTRKRFKGTAKGQMHPQGVIRAQFWHTRMQGRERRNVNV